ncbi:hypothetical protein CEXT_393861 [Caerostris extrusa]|uniref:Uncharacterized protein n=1 Tax=Caerostris extrusa TaxID=172846 RepID=A0AAV4RGP7_CAEEX|nr:hypothetical protein CEXT_393861 [Caerostris extrusa]
MYIQIYSQKDKVTRRNAPTKYFLVPPKGHNEAQQSQIRIPSRTRRTTQITTFHWKETLCKCGLKVHLVRMVLFRKWTGKDSLAIENGTEVLERDFSSG